MTTVCVHNLYLGFLADIAGGPCVWADMAGESSALLLFWLVTFKTNRELTLALRGA